MPREGKGMIKRDAGAGWAPARRGSLLGLSGRMLARLNFDFIYDLLDIRNLLRERLSFFLLGGRLDAARQHERSVLGRIVDTLIVEVFIGFQRCLEIVFDGTVK